MSGRRSLDALPLVLILTAAFAAGTDAWAALERVAARVVATRQADQHPTVMLVLDFGESAVRLQSRNYAPDTRW